MNSLYKYCVNYYLGSGGNKLKNILKNIGSGDLLESIMTLLNEKLSDTTFGEIIKHYRNKMLTHPNFIMSTIEKHIHKKFDILDKSNSKLFSSLVNNLFCQTQLLYINICKRFPEAIIAELE